MTRRRTLVAGAAAAVVLIAAVAAAVTHDGGSTRRHVAAQPGAGEVNPVNPGDSTTSTPASSTTTTVAVTTSPGPARGTAPHQPSPAAQSAGFSGAPIVFARNSETKFEVWMMNPDGSGQRRIDSFPQPDPTPPACGATWPIAHTLGDWSPDGSRFFVLSRCPGTDAVIYDRDGHRIQRFRVSAQSGATDAAWSPDGTQLAADAEGYGALAILDVASGRVLRQFDGFDSHYLGWAPSARIAMIGFKDKTFGLLTVDPLTGEYRKVAAGTFQGRPQWSPDGRILYRDASDPNGSGAMAVVRDTANATVTRLCGDAGDFAWAPDFESVVGAVLDHRSGAAQVSVCPATGGPATATIAPGVNPSFNGPDHVVFSADGSTWSANVDGSGRRVLAAGGPAKPAPR